MGSSALSRTHPPHTYLRAFKSYVAQRYDLMLYCRIAFENRAKAARAYGIQIEIDLFQRLNSTRGPDSPNLGSALKRQRAVTDRP